jgi:predicted MPP superfamily phosphohydrolase
MMGGNMRKPIEQLVENIDKNLFTIMLDHQPYNLNEAVENGIDLQISGHTHHGQMFPLNLITKSIFEVSRGYKQIENTHIYVSTGFGTWGPPVRVGNRPEIVVIEVSSGRQDGMNH